MGNKRSVADSAGGSSSKRSPQKQKKREAAAENGKPAKRKKHHSSAGGGGTPRRSVAMLDVRDGTEMDAGSGHRDFELPKKLKKRKKEEEWQETEHSDADEEPSTSTGSSSQANRLPLTKVRAIMEASPNVSDVKIGAESIFAMAKAAESFIKKLAQGAHDQIAEGHARVSYNDLAEFVQQCDELNFIQDILPRKLKFSEVRKLLKEQPRK